MDEVKPGYTFNRADLVEYAMDKPIGAARAALTIALEGADVSAEVVIERLSENMEINQQLLSKVISALRDDPRKILQRMPKEMAASQLERDLGL
ncbi:hypothetical protein [Pseudomonas sp. BS3782 TE3695]|uniref:hypothetical protein n=1 Tax=Pseudomonas TaxID=286 RepID=UPI003D2624DF